MGSPEKCCLSGELVGHLLSPNTGTSHNTTTKIITHTGNTHIRDGTGNQRKATQTTRRLHCHHSNTEPPPTPKQSTGLATLFLPSTPHPPTILPLPDRKTEQHMEKPNRRMPATLVPMTEQNAKTAHTMQCGNETDMIFARCVQECGKGKAKVTVKSKSQDEERGRSVSIKKHQCQSKQAKKQPFSHPPTHPSLPSQNAAGRRRHPMYARHTRVRNTCMHLSFPQIPSRYPSVHPFRDTEKLPQQRARAGYKFVYVCVCIKSKRARPPRFKPIKNQTAA